MRGSLVLCIICLFLISHHSLLGGVGAFRFGAGSPNTLAKKGGNLQSSLPILRGGFGLKPRGEWRQADRKDSRTGKGVMLSSAAGGVPSQNHSTKDKIELGVLIFIWYAASVMCTNSTKGLGLHWSVVTLAQLLISSLCGLIGIPILGLVKYKPIASRDQLAAVFTMGFVTLNCALGMMHVSLVMTLRATEPIFTLILTSFLLKSEKVSLKMGASLLPVIFGAALSSAESADFRFIGLAISVVCNVMFALRGILTKRLKAAHPVDNFNLFFQVCWLGTLIQGTLLLLSNIFFPVDLQLGRLANASYTSMLLVNGVSFFVYLQLSWLVLSRVAAVTHSVCNSLRRPVMCVFGYLQFGNHISPLNSAGIVMASLGALLYAQVRLADGKSAE